MTAHIQTHSGLMVDPLHLSVQDIRLEDIAHALSNLCRFTGHTSRFYSVAEHSVRVSVACEWVHQQGCFGPTCERMGLLHDASEAYLQDIPSPLKGLDAFAGYRKAEKRAQGKIYDHLLVGRPKFSPDGLHVADKILLHHEAAHLMEAMWTDPVFVLAGRYLFPRVEDLGWPPEEAKARFLARAAELGIA